MVGRFPHLLTLQKTKDFLDHHGDLQRVTHQTRRPLQSSSGPEMMRIHLDPSLCILLSEDLIGQTFLLPPEQNAKRHRAKVTRKVVEIIDQENGHRIESVNIILDIRNGKVEELISCNQLLDHLETAQDNDLGMDQELLKFRAIIGHQGPLKATDPDWKGSKYNVQLEWETGEVTLNPFLQLLLMFQSHVQHMLNEMTY